MGVQPLLNHYRREHRLNQPIQKIVITVPEIWVREGRHAARESLKKIGTDLLQLPVKLLSEPVAAAAYFVHQFKTQEGRYFNGHLLVCDYGGGTLDLSRSSIHNDDIKVLEGTGKGNVTEIWVKLGWLMMKLWLSRF
jgi:molecular chaperone DnaK